MSSLEEVYNYGVSIMDKERYYYRIGIRYKDFCYSKVLPWVHEVYLEHYIYDLLQFLELYEASYETSRVNDLAQQVAYQLQRLKQEWDKKNK